MQRRGWGRGCPTEVGEERFLPLAELSKLPSCTNVVCFFTALSTPACATVVNAAVIAAARKMATDLRLVLMSRSLETRYQQNGRPTLNEF